MRQAIRNSLAAFLAAACLGAGAPSALAADRVLLMPAPAGPLAASDDLAVRQALNDLRIRAIDAGSVRIIVGVRVPFAPEGLMSAANVTRQRDEIASSQAAVLDRVPSLRQRENAVKQFETIPFMGLEVDAQELEALAGLAEVTSIQEDALEKPTLAQSVPLIGGTAAWSSGFTGAGQAVAILDTGVDKTHPFLTGKVVSEACYSTTGGGGTSVCPGGVNSTASGSGVNCSTAVDGCGHGTHVAGIAAGTGTTFSGVAKDAAVIAVQVFSRFEADSVSCGGLGSPPCALSYVSDQILGLQRVYALRTTHNIAAANMSLGGGINTTYCDGTQAARKAAIDNLRAENIATVIASGNDGYTTAIGAPACISTAVSVGATTKADVVASYSNSAGILNLLAPGSSINSSLPGSAYASWNGTSMATPHVAGAWAVMKQKKSSLTVTEGLAALASTGVPITDARNSLVKPRIQLDAALATIVVAGTPPAAPTIGTATAGNAQVSVAFTPGALGTGTLVNHTADCAGVTATGAASPIVVTGLANGTSYACRVRTVTTVGAGPWSALSNSVTPLSPDDGFPSGGSIPAGWVHPALSNAPWVVSNVAPYAGPWSLKSGLITHSQQSDISFTANFTAGTVSFARKVSSEPDWDFLRFYIDGALIGSWSGEQSWSVVSFPVAAGSRTLLWRYVKDGSVNNGSDAAWIDSVVMPPLATVPAAPTIGAATPGNGQASIAFTPPVSNGGSPITSYTATCNPGGFFATGPASPLAVSGLTNGTTYTCSVTATNATGTGAASGGVTVIPNAIVPPTPAAYADLVFTALTPCRLYDSRPGQGGSGTWLAGSTNTINVGPNASYAFQGGSATDCGLLAGMVTGEIAAILASVSTVNQAAAGYLTFFPTGTANPFPYGVSQSYRSGSVQTSFVVMPTDVSPPVFVSGFTSAQTNVIVDVVGYFAQPKAAALECLTPTAGITTAVAAGSTSAFIYSDSCAAGYTSTGGSCSSSSSNMYLMASGASSDNTKHYCQYRNDDAGSQNATATNKCCRTTGR